MLLACGHRCYSGFVRDYAFIPFWLVAFFHCRLPAREHLRPLGSDLSMIKDQPQPVSNDSKPIWELVIADMQERDKVGRERYGTPLQANNGRDALVDAYQEALDLVVYLRQAIEERNS